MPRKPLPGWLQGKPPVLLSPQGKGSEPTPQQPVRPTPPTRPGDSGNTGGGPAPTVRPDSYRPFQGGLGRPKK
jgi:hypothetical protein